MRPYFACVFLAFSFVMPSVLHAQSQKSAVAQSSANDRRLACYREVKMPAQYRVEQHLVKPAQKYYYKRRNGVIELRERPAVYSEERILIKEARVVMQEVSCPD